MATENDSLDKQDTLSECPECGRSDFENEQGLDIHHRIAHGEGLFSRTDLNCDQCGKEFSKQNTNVKDVNFCSQDCWYEYKSDVVRGENHPRYSRVEKVCETCGDEFTVKKKREDTARFCGHACYSEWLSESYGPGHGLWNVQPGYSGRDNPKWKPDVEVECSNCGDTLHRKPSSVEGKDRVFCDMDCYSEWKSENLVGERHPSYVERPVKRNRCPPSIKKEVRERDNHQCQQCGMGTAEHKERRGTVLQVHHIVPSHKFDDRERANGESNLITLCWLCHRKWEKMAGLKPQVVSD